MAGFEVELEYDQVGRVAREYLIDLLEYCDDSKLSESVNDIIAYMSIPGTWREGKYDR